MLKKLALASALVGAVALAALAAPTVKVPAHLDSAGNLVESQGSACLDPTTGDAVSCGGAGAATSANQTTGNTEIGATNETAPATDTAPSGLNGREQRIAQRITSHLGIAQLPSYTVQAVGYNPTVANPTDLICISGSATKTVAVIQFYMGVQSTSAALQTIYFVKRSTANTGGTSTTPTPISYDSSRSAATAVVTVYTAAPTLGNTVGNVRIVLTLSGTLTGVPGVVSMSIQAFPVPSRVTVQTPIILRGTAESLCTNYNAAALTSGFIANYGVEWVEFTAADD